MGELTTLEAQIQRALDDYRPNLYMDGGDVEVLRIDTKGIVHLKMMGACIDCPISLLTMKLGIQRLLKEKFPDQVKGVNAITDIDISALYHRTGTESAPHPQTQPTPMASAFRSNANALKSAELKSAESNPTAFAPQFESASAG
jgi:Fe-S cluster biogenesis protein NfuA